MTYNLILHANLPWYINGNSDKMNADELAHYIKQIKIHEQLATSTNDRSAYWAAYRVWKNNIPASLSRFEHG